MPFSKSRECISVHQSARRQREPCARRMALFRAFRSAGLTVDGSATARLVRCGYRALRPWTRRLPCLTALRCAPGRMTRYVLHRRDKHSRMHQFPKHTACTRDVVPPSSVSGLLYRQTPNPAGGSLIPPTPRLLGWGAPRNRVHHLPCAVTLPISGPRPGTHFSEYRISSSLLICLTK